jgi:hypothetical protein
MKKTKKLALSRETVRQLTHGLAGVVGGTTLAAQTCDCGTGYCASEHYSCPNSTLSDWFQGLASGHREA